MSTERIVIVGAGHAGSSAAAFLRQYGWRGSITLVGEEAGLPYQRPPLSKAWLKGEDVNLLLRPEEFYAANAIELRTSVHVAEIERDNRAIRLKGGERLCYDKLILALGSRLRRLDIPGADLDGVFGLRTRDDADRLKAVIASGRALAIVGGGYIGLEVAATARELGAEVTVVESASRVLARSASQGLSAFLQEFHRDKGIRLELNARVRSIAGSNGHATAICLDDGRTIACHAVVVGVGADSNDQLAEQAKLACDGGIVVDAAARSEDPAIFAIGDCARRPLPRYALNARLESIPSAIEQARQAASAICGRSLPAPEVPWFWSDQSELRLQIAGLNHNISHSVVRGDRSGGRFAFFHLDADRRLQAVEAVNAPADYMAGRLLIAGEAPLDLARLADSTIPIKQLMN